MHFFQRVDLVRDSFKAPLGVPLNLAKSSLNGFFQGCFHDFIKGLV